MDMKVKTPIQAVLTGTWHNQHNSEMYLEVDDSGKIIGSFKTGVSVGNDRSESFPLTGFAKDDVFSFCVDFSIYGSMTTWVGQIVDPANNRFEAMWQMIADAHQDKKHTWKSTWIGHDVFETGAADAEFDNSQKKQASHPMYSGLI
jgi:hypothetical protein